MKKRLLPLLLLFFFVKINAQQSSRYTQTADEFGLDNPAGLSFEEMRYRGTIVSGYLRNQWWLGDAVAGYPRTQALSWLNNRPERYQFGGAFLADKIGETRSFGLLGRYAHTVAEGLKIGISVGGFSQRVAVERLDQYDAGDPVAQAAGQTRWRMSVSGGAFYHLFDRNRLWNWFAGLSFRQSLLLSALPGGDKPPAETDLLAQGGFGRDSWWTGARLRWSRAYPEALDLYLRKYFDRDRYFVGGIFTTDLQHRTAGVQAGLERPLSTGGERGNHYLTVSLGFSKPLSNYVQGGNLIFDGRVTWAWEQSD